MNQLDLIAKKLLEKREEKGIFSFFNWKCIYPSKVIIDFRPIGKTPILSKNSWTINGNNTISDIINLLKDDIRTEEDIVCFLFLNLFEII